MTNEITISKSLAGTNYKVTLGTVRFEKSLIKDVNYVKVPRSTGNQIKDPSDPDFGPVPIKTIDLLQIVHQHDHCKEPS